MKKTDYSEIENTRIDFSLKGGGTVYTQNGPR